MKILGYILLSVAISPLLAILVIIQHGMLVFLGWLLFCFAIAWLLWIAIVLVEDGEWWLTK